MARTFTTFFPYHGSTYTAVISHQDDAVNIYLPDESLHAILPNGKATYHLQQGLQIDVPKLSAAQHLVLTIVIAMEQHEADFKSLNQPRA